MKYKKTPQGIMDIIEIFHKHNLQYVLFKCEHIFEGRNKNLDILFDTRKDYVAAGKFLEKKGFKIRFSEKFEKYKRMYSGLIKGEMFSIHLHREIGWHGVKILDKKFVFRRRKELAKGIYVPSLEDYILIHAGHILFENFIIKDREKGYFKQYRGADKKYIRFQLQKNRWKRGFKRILDGKTSKISIVESWIEKLSLEPFTLLYVLMKGSRVVLRKFSLRRKGSLISLIGVNGAGKSTLTRNMLEEYEQITSHLGLKQKYYYFGWKPEFILTKILSGLLKKKNKNLFKEMNINAKVKKFDLFQEMLFSYLFLEFYYRYVKNIFPLLRKGHLVITDRYFYDIYGQYPYAKNSIVLKLLMKSFPSPDFTYILDVESKELLNRNKVDKTRKEVRYLKRNVMPIAYLDQQRRNYYIIARLIKGKIERTRQKPRQLAKDLVHQTWRSLL